MSRLVAVLDWPRAVLGRLGYKAGEVTLTRGLIHDNSFEDWIRNSQFGKVPDARNGGAIIVFDYGGTRKAGDTNALTEELILTHEELDP